MATDDMVKIFKLLCLDDSLSNIYITRIKESLINLADLSYHGKEEDRITIIPAKCSLATIKRHEKKILKKFKILENQLSKQKQGILQIEQIIDEIRKTEYVYEKIKKRYNKSKISIIKPKTNINNTTIKKKRKPVIDSDNTEKKIKKEKIKKEEIKEED